MIEIIIQIEEEVDLVKEEEEDIMKEADTTTEGGITTGEATEAEVEEVAEEREMIVETGTDSITIVILTATE